MPNIVRYIARIEHDNGRFNLKVITLDGSEEDAIRMIMEWECCPRRAILRIRKLPEKKRFG